MALSDKDIAYLQTAFQHHPPQGDQLQRYDALRAAFKELALKILTLAPESRERSLSLTSLEQAMFWANSSIARNHKEQK